MIGANAAGTGPGSDADTANAEFAEMPPPFSRAMSEVCEGATRVVELLAANARGAICPANIKYASRLAQKALTLQRLKVGM
jgi:hypothetical protein